MPFALTALLSQDCAVAELQLALANVLTHLNGFAASDTIAAVDRARALIEKSEALGEPPEDPSTQFSVLYGVWVASRAAFNGDAMRGLATQFLALAAKQNATVPLMNGHRVMGISLVLTGDISEGRAHLDQATALYDATEHRPLATRFGADVGVSILSYRSLARWLLGYPDGALADLGQMLTEAREIGQSATTMFALQHAPLIHLLCGNHTAANAEARARRLGGRKRRLVLEGARDIDPRLPFCTDRQSFECGPNDHLQKRRVQVNRSNMVCADVPVTFGEGLSGHRPTRRRFALPKRSDERY